MSPFSGARPTPGSTPDGPAPARARRLVLLRHGRTAHNAEHRAQGHLDVPLDELGRAQAAAVAQVLPRHAPVRMWASDLARAHATAEAATALLDLPIQTDPRLREFSVGLRSGLTVPEFAEEHPEAHARWRGAGAMWEVEGGEDVPTVLARVVPALEDCFASLATGETGLVVAHGACLRVAALAMVGLPLGAESSLSAPVNCGRIVLDRYDDEPGRTRLAAYNLPPPAW